MHRRFGAWVNPLTGRPFFKKQAACIWSKGSYIDNRAMHVREELLKTQRLLDRRKVFDGDSKVDVGWA